MVGERTETVMIRLTPEEKHAFKVACAQLGMSMSDVLRSTIGATIVGVVTELWMYALAQDVARQQGGEEEADSGAI